MQFSLAIGGLKNGPVNETLTACLGNEKLDCDGLQWDDLMQDMIAQTISQHQAAEQDASE